MSEAPEAIDPAVVRQITLDVLALAAKVAALTPTPLDDQAIETVTNLVNRDLVWALLVRIISRNTPAAASEITEAVMAGDGDLPEAIDPVTIVTLITTLLPLIQSALDWFRKRRNPTPAPAPTI